MITVKEWGEFQKYRKSRIDEFLKLDLMAWNDLEKIKLPETTKHSFLFWHWEDFNWVNQQCNMDLVGGTLSFLEDAEKRLVPENTVEECLNYLLTKKKEKK